MYKEYIDKLFESLNKIEFHYSRSENVTRITPDYEKIMGKLIDIFSSIKKEKKQIFFIGNGGSAAIASHMTADFMKNGGMKTMSLYDSSMITCMGNDYGYRDVFSKPITFLGGEGDLLVAISSSGKSENILKAIKAARSNKMQVLTFTGFMSDNPVRRAGDANVYVPISEYGIVESIHCMILQQVVDEIMKRDNARI